MAQLNGNGSSATSTSDIGSSQVVDSFKRAVIDRFQMKIDGQAYDFGGRAF